jgi:hypothetical protein
MGLGVVGFEAIAGVSVTNAGVGVEAVIAGDNVGDGGRSQAARMDIKDMRNRILNFIIKSPGEDHPTVVALLASMKDYFCAKAQNSLLHVIPRSEATRNPYNTCNN